MKRLFTYTVAKVTPHAAPFDALWMAIDDLGVVRGFGTAYGEGALEEARAAARGFFDLNDRVDAKCPAELAESGS